MLFPQHLIKIISSSPAVFRCVIVSLCDLTTSDPLPAAVEPSGENIVTDAESLIHHDTVGTAEVKLEAERRLGSQLEEDTENNRQTGKERSVFIHDDIWDTE